MKVALAVLGIIVAFIVLSQLVGFLVHLLWIAAVVLVIVWAVGFIFKRSSSHTWFRW